MKAEAKLDLDAVLGRWPAPARDEAAWDERADAIVRAAIAAKARGGDVAALLEAPSLAAERGEPMSSLMRDSAPGAPRKKQSLREIAERASQAGRPSSPPSRPSFSSAPSELASTPEPRFAMSAASSQASGAFSDSSAASNEAGLLDSEPLEVGAPAEVVAQTTVPSASHRLGDGASPVASLSARRLAAPPKRGGMMAGIAVAVLGMAAAAVIVFRGGAHPSPAPAADIKAIEAPAPPSPTAPAATALATPTPAPVAAGSASPPGVAEAAPKGEAAVPAVPGVVAPAPAAANRLDSSKVAAADSKATPTAPASAAPAPTDAPSDLASAMAQAAGSDGSKPGSSPAPEPAAGTKNSAAPDQPPQGSVTSALGSVMGGAKACVAGADDISRAVVTFAPSGAVANVSVSGWAARKGAADCVKAALKGANVGPFAKPSFTVSTTIRP